MDNSQELYRGNTTTREFVTVNQDTEDKFLSVLPSEIRDYLLFESPVDYRVSDVAKLFAQTRDVLDTLIILRRSSKKITLDTYGANYPVLKNTQMRHAGRIR